MNKLGSFIAGTIVGVVGLGIAAFLVDKYDNSYGSNYHYSNDDDNNSIDIDTNENAETETCAESSPLFHEEQTAEPSAASTENKTTAEHFGELAETIVKAMSPSTAIQNGN